MASLPPLEKSRSCSRFWLSAFAIALAGLLAPTVRGPVRGGVVGGVRFALHAGERVHRSDHGVRRWRGPAALRRRGDDGGHRVGRAVERSRVVRGAIPPGIHSALVPGGAARVRSLRRRERARPAIRLRRFDHAHERVGSGGDRPLGDGIAWSQVAPACPARCWRSRSSTTGQGPLVHAAGSLYASGAVTINQVARWNGSSWSEVGGGVFGNVTSLTPWNDGVRSGTLCHRELHVRGVDLGAARGALERDRVVRARIRDRRRPPLRHRRRRVRRRHRTGALRDGQPRAREVVGRRTSRSGTARRGRVTG